MLEPATSTSGFVCIRKIISKHETTLVELLLLIPFSVMLIFIFILEKMFHNFFSLVNKNMLKVF